MKLTYLEDEIQRQREELDDVERLIAEKRIAEEDMKGLQKERELLHQQQLEVSAKQAEIAVQLEELNARKKQLTIEKDQCIQEKEAATISLDMLETIAEAQSELTANRDKLRYFQTIEAIGYAEMEIRRLTEESASNKLKVGSFPQFIEELPNVRKLQELEGLFTSHDIKPSLSTSLEINTLRRLRADIQNGTYPYALLEWKEVAERLAKGIGYAESLLRKHHFPVEQVRSKQNDQYNTVDEMHDMLDKIARFFAKPTTKQILAMPASSEKAALLHRLADNLAYLYGKAEEVRKYPQRLSQHLIVRRLDGLPR